MPVKPIKPNKQKAPESHLAVTAYGIQAVTGNRDFALFGAVATMLTASSESSSHEVPSRSKENSYDPALTAAMPDFEDFDPHNKMLLSLLNAIIDSTEHLIDKKLQDEKHLLLIVIPASIFGRSEIVDTKEWQESIAEELSDFSDLHFHFLKADDNVTKHLQSACAALTEGKVESVIFAGADSLLDTISCEELLLQNRLRSNTIADGIIPGEAAASVIIQKINHPQQTRAIIKGLSFTDEPNSGKAHTSKMTGLSTVIQSTAQMAQQQPDDIDCVIRNHSSEQHYSFEWYQTTQSIWPNKLPEQERVAFQMGELDEPPKIEPRKMPEELFTSVTLGEIGAASMPLSIILACARFDFNYPTVKNCLVCEVTEFPTRGAIFLENPRAKTSKNV